MSESLEKDNHCIGLKERIEFNQDFKLDWHDKDEIRDGYQLKWIGKDYARLQSGMMTETVIIPNNEHNNKEENKGGVKMEKALIVDLPYPKNIEIDIDDIDNFIDFPF